MNSLEGFPELHVAHVTFVKRVPFSERVQAVFTAQITNVTNTPHFTTPNNNLSNPNPDNFSPHSCAR